MVELKCPHCKTGEVEEYMTLVGENGYNTLTGGNVLRYGCIKCAWAKSINLDLGITRGVDKTTYARVNDWLQAGKVAAAMSRKGRRR